MKIVKTPNVKQFQKSFELASRKAARDFSALIRDEVKGRVPSAFGVAAGSFPGDAATGLLYRSIVAQDPKKISGGWSATVYIRESTNRKGMSVTGYARVHEYGKVIRAKKKLMVFKYRGQLFRVKQVRIRRKRFFELGVRAAQRGASEYVSKRYIGNLRSLGIL